MVYQDCLAVLADLLDDLRSHLEDETNIEAIFRFQGRINGIKVAMTVPDILINLIKETEENDRREKRRFDGSADS